MLDNEKLIQEFALEAQEHVGKIEAGLLEIEQGDLDGTIINAVFRSAHNIKGTAGFFGLRKIVDLAHGMESLLGKIRSKEIIINLKIIDILLAANDALAEMLTDITESEAHEITAHLQNLQDITGVKQTAANRDVIPLLYSTEPESGLDLVQSSLRTSELQDKNKGMLQNLFKYGRKVYKLISPLKSGEADIAKFCKNMSNSIQSIGTVLGNYVRANESFDAADASRELVVLFGSVLDKELTAMALGINEAELTQLDIRSHEVEILHMIEEAQRSNGLQYHDFLRDATEMGLTAQDAKARIQGNDEERIKVDVDLLNHLVTLSSEMVLARNQLLRVLASHTETIPGIRAILQKIDHTTTEMQEKVMRTRMQPVANLFQAIPRLVRELSKNLGKSLTLQIEGKDVELDKSIIEGLIDPFTHLVRNALDHGIETPTMRQRLGKDPAAVLLIRAYHEGGRVVIEIVDDGSGINLEKIKQQAVRQGLISHEQSSELCEQAAINLIFAPGISTAAQVNDISGRGVGLDVVRSNVKKLGGTVEVHTARDKGTTFRLILPLTLAIIPSIILTVSGHQFALPQANLQEIVRIVAGDNRRRIEYIQNQRVLRLRGKVIPVMHLAEVVGLPVRSKEDSRVARVLILKSAMEVFGLLVDEIHDREDILVKPAPSYLKSAAIYSGVTILGDGRIAMVLEANGVAQAAKLEYAEALTEPSQLELLTAEVNVRESQNLLLFQCAGSETFGMALAMIARVEKIDSRRIEKIGEQEFYSFHGKILRLIRPEKYLPVTAAGEERTKLYLIIPKMIQQPVAIVAGKIKDNVQAEVDITEDGIQSKGLLGSAIINGAIVLLLNLYGLLELESPEGVVTNSIDTASNMDKRVLLVEDTPFFATLQKQYLEEAGYQVLTAYNGREALRLLQQKPIDVVVSDIEMPVMNGWEMIKRIRADETLAALPVIATTASVVGEKDQRKLLEAGFDHYDFKFDRLSLLAKVAAGKWKVGGQPA